MKDFNELASLRRELQDKCRNHDKDLFSFNKGISFKVFTKDELDGLGKNELEENLYHITVTATCIESILEIPDMLLSEDGKYKSKINQLKNVFVEKALKRDWKNKDKEGSPGIYNRCRALPLVISNMIFKGPKDSNYKIILDHILHILSQLKKDGRKAIGEVKYNGDEKVDSYPENAYHTFYTLKIIESFINSTQKAEISIKLKDNGEEDEKKNSGISIEKSKTKLIDWSIEFLAKQIAYHDADSSFKDSDQLAWVLAILTHFKENLMADLSLRDLIEKGFDCLFKAQKKDGSWIAGKPLFHEDIGDARCYMFETFSEIIKNALQKKNEFLRKILKKYYKNLKNIINYAGKTCIYENGHCLWSSGHRINKPYPESWATASVYSFYQLMRRLIGYWTKNEVINNLKKPNIIIANPDDSLKDIIKRGSVWQNNKNEVQPNEHLLTSFVNPILIKKIQAEFEIEPDKYIIEENQSRSAILFGPPGTSKTRLIQAVAGAIEWDYIEIHANDFLSEGLNDIHKKADEIFNQLMELDQAVILFDEIDELVRSRENKNGSDIFGRFLTTSMLPKIAELWKQRKVLFFVATNYLNDFDSAITRGQRFDSLIFVPPPSFKVKKEELKKILKENYNLDCNIDEEEVEDEINKIIEKIEKISKDDDKHLEQAINETNFSLIKFVLIRYDQLPSLAKQLYEKIQPGNGSRQKLININKELLADSLNNIADPRLKCGSVIKKFINEKNRNQINDGHMTVWEFVDISKNGNKLSTKINFLYKGENKLKRSILAGTKSKENETNGKYWFITPYPIDENFLNSNDLEKKEDEIGKLKYRKKTASQKLKKLMIKYFKN